MLRFAVFDESGPAKAFTLAHAYAIDKQGDAIPATVQFSDGIIAVRPSVSEPTAFALSRPVGAAGTLTLQTTPLPMREKPYLLDLELARHRIMLLIVKLEDWGLAPLLPSDHPVLADLDAARDLMTAALCAPSATPGVYAAEQASIAARSLELAVLASERLATLHAERWLAQRLGAPVPDDGLAEVTLDTPDTAPAPDPDNAGPTDPPGQAASVAGVEVPRPSLGCLVHSERFAPPLQNIIKQSFDFISVPLRWSEIETEEGRYDFRPTDRWIEWGVRGASMPVHAGPIIDLHPRALPDWLGIWEHDYETMREFAFEHCARVVKRYRRAIKRWIAISGPTVDEGIRLALDQWVDLARLTTLAVRKSAPGTPVAVEIAVPFGQHPGGNESFISPKFLAEMLLHAGVQFDSLSLRIQLGSAEIGHSARDLMQIAALIDEYAQFEHIIDVSVLGAPSAPTKGTPPRLEPGGWHGTVTPETQAEFATRAITILAGHPVVRSVAWQALYDTQLRPEQAEGGLITSAGKAKPALLAINAATAALRSGRLPGRPASAEQQPTAPSASG